MRSLLSNLRVLWSNFRISLTNVKELLLNFKALCQFYGIVVKSKVITVQIQCIIVKFWGLTPETLCLTSGSHFMHPTDGILQFNTNIIPVSLIHDCQV